MKFNYINDAVKIDFKTSKLLENTMKEAEQLDSENNVEYFCVAESIDVIAKGLVASKIITEEQWEQILKRYPLE